MDPKQTEGQKSGSVPQAQGGFSFQTGTLSTGANIARTMNDLNANDRKSATVNSPFAKHHFDKVAPQTGDILIASSSPRPKFSFFSRKKATSTSPSMVASGYDASISEKKGPNRGRLIQFGLILGGLALVGLVIFAVVMLVNQPKKSNNTTPSTPQVVTQSAEDIFSEYISLFTSNNEEDSDISAIWQDYIYNYSYNYVMQQMDAPVSDTRTDYFESLNEKWNEFVQAYDGTFADTGNLTNISFYFHDIALLTDYDEQSLYDLYTSNEQNLDETKKIVNETMISDNSSYALGTLLDMRKNLYDATLDVINDAKNAGCLSEKTIFHSCDEASLPAYANYKKILDSYNAEFPKKVNAYKILAFNSLSNICIDVFGNNMVDDSSSVDQGDLQ